MFWFHTHISFGHRSDDVGVACLSIKWMDEADTVRQHNGTPALRGKARLAYATPGMSLNTVLGEVSHLHERTNCQRWRASQSGCQDLGGDKLALNGDRVWVFDKNLIFWEGRCEP